MKKNKVVVENDLRWEDDGGPAVEIADPSPPSGGESVSPDDGRRWK